MQLRGWEWGESGQRLSRDWRLPRLGPSLLLVEAGRGSEELPFLATIIKSPDPFPHPAHTPGYRFESSLVESRKAQGVQSDTQ